MNRFSNPNSHYHNATDDPKAIVLNYHASPIVNGRIDITDILQSTLTHMNRSNRCGVLFLPENDYIITKTIYFPRGIRMYGFGKNRPSITLPKATTGFDQGDSPFHDDMKYMFWVTTCPPVLLTKENKHRFCATTPDGLYGIDDANPGTFYTGISNVNFVIEDDNPCAVVMRTHFAQTSYISYCDFLIGNGKAGIDAVGNEMEHLYFEGGEYGIWTGKTSPGWPFVLTDTDFVGQRKACYLSNQNGTTSRRVSFGNSPCAMTSLDGHWDKQMLIDCILENIHTGIEIFSERNTCTQHNMTNVLCKNVTTFAKLMESNKTIDAKQTSYIVESFTHGYVQTLGEEDMTYTSDFVLSNADISSFAGTEVVPQMPDQSTWVNVTTFGAVGDGITDDTKALQAAGLSGKTIYFPQGNYITYDTILLVPTTNFIGLNPISTCLTLPDDAPLYARIGSPKALLETPQNGTNYISGFVLDVNARNPRAVACIWQAGEHSYLYDIKILGGHGSLSRDADFLPPYNKSRTADYDENRWWDSQYWSIWVTNGGGGIFKNIWTASPYASAGLCISETSTKGAIYQISSEHHVRHEIIMRNVSNWSFYAIQTEEEVAEGSYCLPFELSDCENLLFGNYYTFRVIWVDNEFPTTMKTWNCKNISFQNVHNFTQMKFTMNDIVVDAVSGESAGFWQLAKLTIEDSTTKVPLSQSAGEAKLMLEQLDYVDAMCQDSKGNIYFCDSRVHYIYKYNILTETFHYVSRLHYRPVSLACDSQDNLLVVTEYKPVPGSLSEEGVPELSLEDHGERSRGDWGACFYVFYSFNRRVRVYSMNPTSPEASLVELKPQNRKGLSLDTLYYPSNQWRDNNDFMKVITIPDENCYVAPDGVTGIVHTPAIARSCHLVAATAGSTIYLVDEYGKQTVKLDVLDNLDITNPTIVQELGEYSSLMTPNGHLYVCDNHLYDCYDGKRSYTKLQSRPACLLHLVEQNTLIISARDKIYSMKLGD
ncbi:MAG: glycosyl hydrolase family 28-related protein [Eubacteriales bacterium]